MLAKGRIGQGKISLEHLVTDKSSKFKYTDSHLGFDNGSPKIYSYDLYSTGKLFTGTVILYGRI